MPDTFEYFGGVDFSGAREPLANLWTALGHGDDGRLRIVSLRPHAFRLDLATFVANGWRPAARAGADDGILWGVDFACGVPASAAPHLSSGPASWEASLAWIADRPADEVRDAIPEDQRGARLTDSAAGSIPFDTRSYRQTVEGIRWLHQLREEHGIAVVPQEEVGRASTVIVEVSPTLTTLDLGLPRRRAPSRPGEHRARAAALRTFLDFENAELESIAVTLEDAWDAALSCLTAWLVRDDLDQPFRTAPSGRDVLELEGWVYRAPAALESGG